MLRLQTLGQVFVASETGEPLGGAAAQRRTLALLSVLALAGEGGLSRDKIVGLLWPETDAERARHSLTQALYAARRALKADDLFTVNADVRVNRQRLVCDVNELESALDSGELERAVALYTGSFLDGFFLSGSPEFEQWSSMQRERLEGRMVGALERLAETAVSEGDYRRAGEWRKRISTLRPLDADNTVKLMTALVESGDRAGALQHARVHELLLKEQFDLDPDPAVVGLVQKLREPASPAVTVAEARGNEPRPGFPPAAAVDEPFRDGSTRPDGSFARWISHLRSHRASVAGIALLLLVLTAVAISRSPRSPSPAATEPLRQKLVVAPFRVAGADAALGYLRDGIVELLSTRLADDSAARAVDAGAVLGAWEDAGFSSTVSHDSVVRLAARLGAERVVIGSVVGTPRHMILRASVLAVPSAELRGEAMVQGPSDSISGLIDGLAAKLLVSQAGEDERLTNYTTGSLRSLRAYLEGQAAFRQDDYDAAARRYEAALQLDPTFPLAALRLALVADRRNDDQQRRRSVALAWTSRDDLSERDRALLGALAGPKYPLSSVGAEQVAAWRRVIDLSPNDPESWSLLGARLYHDGAVAGVPDARFRAISALQRALSIDPDNGSAALLLTHLAMATPEAQLAKDFVLDPDIVKQSNPLAPLIRWRIALGRKDSVELRRVRTSLPGANISILRSMAMASQFDGVGMAEGAQALSVLGARVTRRADRIDLVLAQHSLAIQQGRPRAALEATTRLGALELGSHAHLRLRVLDALYAEGDTAAAADAAEELGRFTAAEPGLGPFTPETLLPDLCVLSQWRVSRGDTAGVRAGIEALRRAVGNPEQLPAVSAAPAVCADLLDVWLAAVSTRADALQRMERFDSLALTSQVAGDAIAYAPIRIARLFEHLGDQHRALAAIRKRSYMSGWPRYQATAWREEGRLAEQAGDYAGAEQSYGRYLAIRTAPADALRSEVAEIRRRLAALPR